MKITAIKQQAKLTNRYSIFVDDAYSFSLSETALLDSQLVKGQELSSQQVDDYKQLSADDKVYARALRYVAMRPRSVGELRMYLRRKEAPEAFIETTLQKLQDLRLLDDAAFAISFVRDRQLLRPTSRRKLQMELKKRYVADQYIAAAFEENELQEVVSLQDVIAKKRRQSKYQDDDKLMQYLARQGFGYSDIKDALRDTSD